MQKSQTQDMRWDLESIFPSLNSTQYEDTLKVVKTHIDSLRQTLEDIEKIDSQEEQVQVLDKIIETYNTLGDNYHKLYSYVYCNVTADSRNIEAQKKLSELDRYGAQIQQINSRITAWIGKLNLEEVIQHSEIAKNHEFYLRESQIRAKHLMHPEQEDLYSDLALTGSTAWEKLYSNLTSQITATVSLPEGEKELPISAVRNLALHSDRKVRENAYKAEISAWERWALPIASALNSIKGESITISQRRGWSSPLEQALFRNRIDFETLNAMMEAAQESFPSFREYLQTKASIIGVNKLAWYDIFAPVGRSSRSWTPQDAKEFIVEQFHKFSQKLGEFAQRAFDSRWIDLEPRVGKVGGAYCISIQGEESRILANYESSFDSVSTLAHELGHAYHNLNKSHRTYLQKSTPMTLAETASTFCETIIQKAALENSDKEEQILILEGALQNSCQIVVDITSRFIFEKEVIDRRKDTELSIEDLKIIMTEAQKATYGDALDIDKLHPYMWAAKPHYYGSDFYNFPYMFGLLFGLGLYAAYEESPEKFKAKYDELLSSTGMFSAADLALKFGINIRDKSFWRSSLQVIKQDIARFKDLVA